MSDVQSIVEYRDIPGFPGYRVGNDGSVWSCRIPKSGKVGTKWHRLKGSRGIHGHLSVVLRPSSLRRSIHHLVLEAFVGPCPDGMEACHSPDYSPANNSISNLRWDTHENNGKDTVKHGRTRQGAKATGAKLTDDLVRQIRLLKNTTNLPDVAIAKRFNVSRRTITRVVGRTHWKHVA